MALVITGAGGLITMTNVSVPVPPKLEALITDVIEVAVVGVPVIAPVSAFSVSPSERLVAPNRSGLLDAVIV